VDNLDKLRSGELVCRWRSEKKTEAAFEPICFSRKVPETREYDREGGEGDVTVFRPRQKSTNIGASEKIN
jgi:hypothetical protein